MARAGITGMVRRANAAADGAHVAAAGFDAFYTAGASRLLGQVHAMTGDLGEAQDVVQEAYLRAWQRWDRVSTYEDPSAWVHSVAWRLAVNRWHRRRNALRAWTRHGPPPDLPEVDPTTTALVTALRQVPAVQRQAVVLHHLVGMTVEQIAAETGTPEGTIKARLTRGRARLAGLLAEEDPA